MRAADHFAKGELSQAEIARELGVAHQTVSDGHEKWRAGGKEALKSAGRVSSRFDFDCQHRQIGRASIVDHRERSDHCQS